MIRKSLINKKYGENDGFRWRGGEVSRIEGFSDAVFAFAITLLVVSLEVPNNFNELLKLMQGFGAFGICFALLVMIWHSHYLFFRQYGLQDNFIIVFNSILLFVVLFYIYPLKFLFTFLINQVFHFDSRPVAEIIQLGQTSTLMIIYSAGYFAVFFIFLVMHIHAFKLKDILELNDLEILHTKNNILVYSIHMFVSFISILISVILGSNYAFYAGIIYVLLGPLMAINGKMFGNKIKKLNKTE